MVPRHLTGWRICHRIGKRQQLSGTPDLLGTQSHKIPTVIQRSKHSCGTILDLGFILSFFTILRFKIIQSYVVDFKVFTQPHKCYQLGNNKSSLIGSSKFKPANLNNKKDEVMSLKKNQVSWIRKQLFKEWH